MAKGRMLARVISISKKFPNLKTDSARLLYLMILPHLDIKGRFYAEAQIIKGQIVPRLKFSERKIELCIEDMARAKLIKIYLIDGEKYLEYIRFADFQSLRPDRENPSMPEPTAGALREYSRSTPAEVKLSKDKLSKDNIHVPEYLELAVFLKTQILKNNPKAKITDSQVKNWTDDVRLMVEQDKRTLQEIRDLITWAQADDFWRGNILSMGKLRKQFDRLTMQKQRGRGNGLLKPEDLQ